MVRLGAPALVYELIWATAVGEGGDLGHGRRGRGCRSRLRPLSHAAEGAGGDFGHCLQQRSNRLHIRATEDEGESISIILKR